MVYNMSEPVASKRKHLVKFDCGREKLDNYYWLRDDSRSDKKVLRYLEEENKYCESKMKSMGMMEERDRIRKELIGRLVEDYDTVKKPCNNCDWGSEYLFFERYKKGDSHPIYMYEKAGDVVEYMNVNKLKKKGEMLAVVGPKFSRNLEYVSFGFDRNGSERYKMKLYKFPEMKEVKIDLPELMYGSLFIDKNKIYYCVDRTTNKLDELWEYDIISKKSVRIYDVDESEKERSLDVFMDGGCLFYGWWSYSENECYCKFLDEDREDILVNKWRKNVKYQVKKYGDYFALLGGFDGCVNNVLKLKKIGEKRMKKVVDYNKEEYLEKLYIVKNNILLEGRKDGRKFLKLVGGKNMYFGDNGCDLNVEFVDKNSDKILIKYEDLLEPVSYYEMDIIKGTKKLVWRETVKDYDKNKYEYRRIWVKSGKNNLPVDMISRKGKNDDRMLLYGYNSYGINIECNFDWKRFVLIDRGFRYCIANVRGSSYFGESFYREGRMLRKKGSFVDFERVAEYLKKNKYCKELSIEGRSAGGLLVGACSVRKPKLYKNVIAGVPFVDVLVTMGDESIPLTVEEWKEIGNPNVEKFFRYIESYSPVDNIKEGRSYPNYFITAGLNDPRVGYWEPAKFVATMRERGKGGKVLFKVDLKSGHFGGKDRYKYLDEISDKFAFLQKMI